MTVNRRTQERERLMSIQEVSAEELAELFHHYHHALAPDFGCTGDPDSEKWNKCRSKKRTDW